MNSFEFQQGILLTCRLISNDEGDKIISEDIPRFDYPFYFRSSENLLPPPDPTASRMLDDRKPRDDNDRGSRPKESTFNSRDNSVNSVERKDRPFDGQRHNDRQRDNHFSTRGRGGRGGRVRHTKTQPSISWEEY
jgi:hypothetical protein